jgi:hypothetical protein
MSEESVLQHFIAPLKAALGRPRKDYDFVHAHSREPADDMEIKRLKFEAGRTRASRDEALATITPDAGGVPDAQRKFYQGHLEREERWGEWPFAQYGWTLCCHLHH